MKLVLGSLGVILVLAHALIAYPSQSFEDIGSENNSQQNHSISIDNDDDEQVGLLNRSQMNLIRNWRSLKNADTIAKKLNLHMAYRVTLYLPIKDQVRMEDYGPNAKLELFNQLVNLIANVSPDSANAVYTTLPPEYVRLYKKGQMKNRKKTTVITTTSSSALSGDRSDRSDGSESTQDEDGSASKQ